MTGIPARCTVPGQEAAQPELEILLQPGHGNVAAMTTLESVSVYHLSVSERSTGGWRLAATEVPGSLRWSEWV